MIFIISCGKAKQNKSDLAMNLYTGCYFKSNLRFAQRFVSNDSIYILSAKYGLIKSDDKIQPYDLKMGDKGCVDVAKIAEQAEQLGLRRLQVIGLCSGQYSKILKKIFFHLSLPIEGLPIGKAMQKLKCGEKLWQI